MREWFETAFDRLYPVLYRHRDEVEAKDAAAAFASRVGGRGRVLDLACGTGRHMAAFGDAGLDMVGLDLSGYLLERAARDPALRGRLVRGDMRALPFRDGAFGGVINMFTSFGYFDTGEEHRRVLEEVARVLRPGGRFLLDFMNAHRAVRSGLGRTVRHGDGYTIEEDRVLEEDGRRLVKRVRVTHPDEEPVEYDERVRAFTPGELDALLSDAGFEVVARFGDYQGGPFSEEASDRLILLSTARQRNHGGE